VVHLGFVNRPSAAGNAEITGKSHEIVKLAAIGKLDADLPAFVGCKKGILLCAVLPVESPIVT
jgi:hypothetical protein